MKMDRSEPALVPEWLKSSGSIAGGSGRQQHSASTLHSDDRSTTKHGRNKSSSSSGVHASDRTTSSYFRRSSSSKGSTHSRPYSSTRSLRDGAREGFNEFQDDDEPIFSLNKTRDYSDPLGSLLPGKFDKDTLSRSTSTNGRRQEDVWRNQAAGGFNNARNGFRSLSTGLLTKGTDTSSAREPAFEHDFPSLGADERRGSELGRVPSPGPGTPFPRPSSAALDKSVSDGWTSALAEVPGVVVSHSASTSNSVQPVTGNSTSVAQTTNGLKMAEAVAQSPARARTPPQLSVDTQRLEELAIKQSRQLIPMTPSMPKSQLVSPLERSKTRAVQQQTKLSPAHLGSQSLRGGLARIEVGKTSHLGKLQVLKPSAELNGATSTVKENLGSPNGVKVLQSSLNAVPLNAGSQFKNSVTNQNLAGSERKPAASIPILEKRPSLQTQSRNDFFNLIKKKSSTGITSGCMDDGRPDATSVVENPEPLSIDAGAVDMDAETKLKCSSANSVSNLPNEGCGEVDELGNTCELTLSLIRSQEEHLNYPDEEEVAFLRSLGWEEDAGDEDDEGLTEEEIRAFYEEYMKLRPSCKPLGDQQKFPLGVSEKFCNGSIGWSPDRPGTQS